MKTLRLTLCVSNLGKQTHVWFPASQGKFSIIPTEIQADKKYGNKIAYFYFSEKDSPFRPPAGRAGTERTVLNKIQIVASFPITQHLNSSANIKQFLRPNRFVQSDDKTIISLAENLTKNCVLDEEKARRCFDFVANYLTYANPIRGLYSSLQALTDRGVDCGGFSTLLVSLLRAVKIPARCVFGWAIQSKFGYHAWAEYYDRQKEVWISADPSVTHLKKKTKLDAGLGFINDDRVTLSVGEDIDLVGERIKWTTPLLQSPVIVSVDKSGLPRPILEDLNWFVV